MVKLVRRRLLLLMTPALPRPFTHLPPPIATDTYQSKLYTTVENVDNQNGENFCLKLNFGSVYQREVAQVKRDDLTWSTLEYESQQENAGFIKNVSRAREAVRGRAGAAQNSSHVPLAAGCPRAGKMAAAPAPVCVRAASDCGT
ncbi:unnamed protein product [Spodoptera exigua]|nr:unnamed protein product [Spodoptera exigua]